MCRVELEQDGEPNDAEIVVVLHESEKGHDGGVNDLDILLSEQHHGRRKGSSGHSRGLEIVKC